MVEEVVFVWDGTTLAEQRHSGGTNLTWDWEPGSFKPLTQTERSQVAGAPQSWVDERFYSIITDLVGAPSELIDASGNVAWRAGSTIWGRALTEPAAGPSTPLRFPGQYFDAETG